MAEGNGVPRWVQERLERIDDLQEDHEARMRKLEEWKADVRVDIKGLVDRRIFWGVVVQTLIGGAFALLVALISRQGH